MAKKGIAEIDFEKDIEPIEESIFKEVEQKPKDPTMLDPEWEAFVLSKFVASELIKGRPKVIGLRRVVRLLMGPILESISLPVAFPSLDNGQRCTATCSVTVLVNKPAVLESHQDPYEITVTDSSDAWHENVTGIEFIRYPVAMACTRAEGRALRKLLSIATPAAEEVSDQLVDVDSLNNIINDNQIMRIDIKCEQLNIDVWKFMNHGKKKYNKVKDIRFDTAAKMLGALVEYERNDNIPEEIKGYNPDWRE